MRDRTRDRGMAVLILLGLVGAACAPQPDRAAMQPDPGAVPTSSAATPRFAHPASQTAIRLNQIGFLPRAAKWAVVPETQAGTFEVVDVRSGDVVERGSLGVCARWAPAEEAVHLAQFSGLSTPGTYRLRVPGLADSPAFVIDENVYADITAASIKAFYYNRASTALLPGQAGAYARAAGHPDTEVRVHVSAASEARPEGTVISSPRGWYDAGDYNKYVVNSGIATYTLLAAYEHHPRALQSLDIALPESGDAVPDLLDEVLWNLEWMLTMQDPNDGGVYHKLTNPEFDPMVMPEAAISPRVVVQKTTAATLDFAAVMAVASRIFAAFEDERPGLALRMRRAAESAWTWARVHPDVIYVQPADIRTGAYGDRHLADEFAWAAAELFITTGERPYYDAMQASTLDATVPSWSDVRSLAWISLAHHDARLPPAADRGLIHRRVVELAHSLRAAWMDSAWGVGMRPEHFVWGSNAVALNQAMILLQAHRLSGERDFLDAAQGLLDYVLGRNAVGMSQVTGHGTHSPRHPHHRPSEADGIEAPVPGFLVGGPNPAQQDRSECPVPYPSDAPAKSYLDHVCSYASNEIAINWNAPLVYVLVALQAQTAAAGGSPP